MKKYFLQFISLAFLLTTGLSALAQLKIEVTGVGSDQIPISVANFAGDQPGDQSISGVVRADLARSGLFRIIESNEVIPENAPLDAATWKARGADAVVTDPPYGLSFMGKRWDYDVPSVDVWAECMRVLKPGGHLLAFAGPRTH